MRQPRGEEPYISKSAEVQPSHCWDFFDSCVEITAFDIYLNLWEVKGLSWSMLLHCREHIGQSAASKMGIVCDKK